MVHVRALRDDRAARVFLDHLPPRTSRQERLILELESGQAAAVDADHPEDLRSKGTGRVVAPALVLEADARKLAILERLRGGDVHAPRQVDEPPAAGQPVEHAGRGKAQRRGNDPRFASRVADQIGVGEDGPGRKRHRQFLSGSIEDRSPRRRQWDVPHPLIPSERLERGRVLHLEQDEARKDAAEAKGQDEEHGDESRRRRPRATSPVRRHQG